GIAVRAATTRGGAELREHERARAEAMAGGECAAEPANARRGAGEERHARSEAEVLHARRQVDVVEPDLVDCRVSDPPSDEVQGAVVGRDALPLRERVAYEVGAAEQARGRMRRRGDDLTVLRRQLAMLLAEE